MRAAARVGSVALAYIPAEPPIPESERGWGREKAREANPLAEVDYIRISVASQYAMHVRQLLHYWRYEFLLPPEVVEVRRQRAKEARERKLAESLRTEGRGGDEQKDDAEQEGKGKPERDDVSSFRMFRGARLVLLDNNQAVLTA